ncbi:MAG: hypothetical protein Q8P41_20725 [Pseudomonadota bacterium]|nr:hypothetical protein [Pseudomonadota bacterium]
MHEIATIERYQGCMLLLVSLLAHPAAASPWSTDLADLEPAFRGTVERVMAKLSARGFTPHVGTSWRSPELQDLLFAIGKSTQLAGGRSCHNHVDAAGAPAARAVDLWNAPVDLWLVAGAAERLAAEAPFLRALGEVARAEGLRWGGDWHGHASAWDAYGLGWDPAHVEVRGCAG